MKKKEGCSIRFSGSFEFALKFFQILTISDAHRQKLCGKNEVRKKCGGCELKCGQSKDVSFKEKYYANITLLISLEVKIDLKIKKIHNFITSNSNFDNKITLLKN